MSHVPSAGMFNLGQKDLTPCGYHKMFCIIIEVTEPRDVFIVNKLISRRRRVKEKMGAVRVLFRKGK